jgi:hypothetical protein
MRTPSNSDVHSRTQESTLVLKANARKGTQNKTPIAPCLCCPGGCGHQRKRKGKRGKLRECDGGQGPAGRPEIEGVRSVYRCASDNSRVLLRAHSFVSRLIVQVLASLVL